MKFQLPNINLQKLEKISQNSAVRSLRRWRYYIALVLGICALLSGIATYLAAANIPPFGDDPKTIISMLNVNLAILILLGAMVIWWFAELWQRRQKGEAGSRIHMTFVGIFAAMALIPTLILAIFSTLLFNLGHQTWFSDQVRTTVYQSLSVTQAYLDEHKQTIRGDVLAMGYDISRYWDKISDDKPKMKKFLNAQMKIRGLSASVIFNSKGEIVSQTDSGEFLTSDPIPKTALDRAKSGQVVVLTSGSVHDDKTVSLKEQTKRTHVRALLRLDDNGKVFLYVGRSISRDVLNHINNVKSAVENYKFLESNRDQIEKTYSLIFVTLSMLLLFAAMGGGFWFASRLVKPVKSLIFSSERLGRGIFSTRVDERDMAGEWSNLGQAFNKMANQIESNQLEIMAMQKQAAWSDVARRVAHEIKNPLTPIQLASERLRRKYLPMIEEDTEKFENCVDTIARQVEDIRRLVNEFSNYAKMPDPEKANHNLTQLCKDIILLHQGEDNTKITFKQDGDDIQLNCDAGQIRESVTNIIRNALQAIEARIAIDPEPAGHIDVMLGQNGNTIILMVEDNGQGLPDLSGDELTKAYVTTRQKGTGLGLSIVKKIMEDHNGEVRLERREDIGSRVLLIFRV